MSGTTGFAAALSLSLSLSELVQRVTVLPIKSGEDGDQNSTSEA